MKRFLISLFTSLLLTYNVLPAFAKSNLSEAEAAKKKTHYEQVREAHIAKKKALRQEAHQEPRERKSVLAVFLKDVSGTTLTLQRGNRYFRVDASSATVYQKQDGQRVRVRLEDLVTGSKLKVLVRKDRVITVWQVVPVANVATATDASAGAEVSGSPPGNSSTTASGVTEVSGSGPGN